MPETPITTSGRFDITKPVEVAVKMTIKGYLLHGETQETAEARMALWAEQRINAVADIRAHVEMLEGVQV